MKPLVSILIPAYNSEKWIACALTSALQQTWENKEVIVVDDGSTDNTLTAIKEHSAKYLKVVSQENAGACSARNKALHLAQGEYIQWLDADDVLEPNKIEKQMKLVLADGNENILYSSEFGTFYYRTVKSKIAPNSLWHDLSPTEWFERKFYNDDSLFPAIWLVSRKLTDKAGGWDNRLTLDDDGEYFGRVVASCEAIKFVPGARSFYRQANRNSLSKIINQKSCQSLFLAYVSCIQYFTGIEDTERARCSAVKYLQTNFSYFFPEHEDLVHEMAALAKNLGGHLEPPYLGDKYRLLVKLLGFTSAKKLIQALRHIKLSSSMYYDHIIFILEGRVRQDVGKWRLL